MTSSDKRLFPGPRPPCFDYCTEAATGVELAAHFAPDGFGGTDNVFEYTVDDVFLEYADIAIGRHVFLERLQLKAIILRHVADPDNAEIWQSGLGADGGELGDVDLNLVSWVLVGPRFNLRQRGIESGSCVLVGVPEPCGFSFRHVDIVNVRTELRRLRRYAAMSASVAGFGVTLSGGGSRSGKRPSPDSCRNSEFISAPKRMANPVQ